MIDVFSSGNRPEAVHRQHFFFDLRFGEYLYITTSWKWFFDRLRTNQLCSGVLDEVVMVQYIYI